MRSRNPFPRTSNSFQRPCRSDNGGAILPLAAEAIPPRTDTTGRIDLRRVSIGGYNKTPALAHNRLCDIDTQCVFVQALHQPSLCRPWSPSEARNSPQSSRDHSEKNSLYPILKQSLEKGRISGLKPRPCLSSHVLPSAQCYSATPTASIDVLLVARERIQLNGCGRRNDGL